MKAWRTVVSAARLAKARSVSAIFSSAGGGLCIGGSTAPEAVTPAASAARNNPHAAASQRCLMPPTFAEALEKCP